MTARRAGLAALAALVLLAGGYLAGRYSAPTKVMTRDVFREQTSVKAVRTADASEAKKENHAADVRIVRVTRWLPAGVVEQTETQVDKSTASTDTRKVSHEAEVRTVEHAVYQEKLKIVERNRPNWSLAVQPGYQAGGAPDLLGGLSVKGLTAAVVLERRVMGPVFLGVWGSSRMGAGVSARVEW